MPSLRRLLAALRIVRVWIVLGVMAPLGMLLVSGFMLYELRQEMWARAEETSQNLLRVIETDIARNVEIMDLALRGMLAKIENPLVVAAPGSLRELLLFDRVVTAEGMGILVLFDEHGNGVLNSRFPPNAGGTFRDRDYFEVHLRNPDAGLYISKPYQSRMSGAYTVAFSRRVNKPDGSFGGVVAATLKLSHFTRMLAKIGLGPASSLNLVRQDGIRIVRFPYDVRDVGTNLSGAPVFQRVVRERNGSFAERARRDGVHRLFTFTQVGDWPLILSIGMSTEEIEAGWRAKALMIGVTLLALFGVAVLLALLCGRELRRREAVEAELARLSMTDGLTGLPNRRRFDEILHQALKASARSELPLALLIVDADHFKRFNDRYGHAVGDEILRGLAHCLSACIHRPHDLVCRIGGEEFGVILPETDAEGAARVAERLHDEVATLALPASGLPAGSVTVSIGLAEAAGGPQAELYRAADAALYAAKSAGRNCTCRAEPRPAAAHLRLVGGADVAS